MTNRNPFVNMIRAFKCKVAGKPGKSLLFFCSVSSVLWALQSALQKNILPDDAVESVCWGAKLQLGYFKHPPLSAWIAYLTALVTGHCDFFQYLLDSVCTVIGVWFVYKLAREFFDEKRAAVSAMLLFSVHYYTPPLMVFCPNSVLFALQPLMAYLFIRAVKWNRPVLWAGVGIVSALAFLGKYSAGLLLVCMAAGMIFHPIARRRILSIGPWLAAAIFFLAVSPHLWWMYRNDFVTLTYVNGSLKNPDDWAPWIYSLFIIGTGLYPLLAEAVVLLLMNLPRHFHRCGVPVCKNALYWSLFWTIPPVILYAILSMTGEHVVAMWLATLVSFSGILVVSVFPFRITRRTFRRLFFVLCAVTAAVMIGISIDLDVRTRDRIHMKPELLLSNVERFMKANVPGKTVPCLAGNRGIVNSYEYYHPAHPASFDEFDLVLMKKNQKKFDEEGVLLVSRYGKPIFECMERIRPGSLDAFKQRKLSCWEVQLECRAPHGKVRRDKEDNPLVLIWLPPLKEMPK